MDMRVDEGDREGEDEGTRKGLPASPYRPCLYSNRRLFKKPKIDPLRANQRRYRCLEQLRFLVPFLFNDIQIFV